MNRKEILILSIIIFLTVIFWLISDIYHIAKTQKNKDIKIEVNNLNIVDYKINKNNLEDLKKKEQ